MTMNDIHLWFAIIVLTLSVLWFAYDRAGREKHKGRIQLIYAGMYSGIVVFLAFITFAGVAIPILLIRALFLMNF